MSKRKSDSKDPNADSDQKKTRHNPFQLSGYPKGIEAIQRNRWNEASDIRRTHVALTTIPLDPSIPTDASKRIDDFGIVEGRILESIHETPDSHEFARGLVDKFLAALGEDYVKNWLERMRDEGAPN